MSAPEIFEGEGGSKPAGAISGRPPGARCARPGIAGPILTNPAETDVSKRPAQAAGSSAGNVAIDPMSLPAYHAVAKYLMANPR